MCTIATSDPLLKIKIIYDNRKDNPALKEGFGFSCVVEWGDRKILFDTGGDRDAFFANAEKLKIRFDEITHVVFSHKHWDHTVAFEEVLNRLRDKTQVFVPIPFSDSLLQKVPKKIQLKTIESFSEIDKNIYSLVLKGGFFLYEQSLVFDTPKGLVILTGCAHPGIIEILKAAQAKLPRKVHLVMGGFHLHHSFSSTSAKVVGQFIALGVEKVAPCHCAGDRAISQFQAAFKNNFIKVGTGSILEIGKKESILASR